MSLNMFYQTVKYPHRRCIAEQRSGESTNVIATAMQLVHETVCSAKEYIAHDVPEVFYYKFPLNYKAHASTDESPETSTSSTKSSLNAEPPATPNPGEKQYFDYNDDLSWIAHSIMTEARRGDARHPDDIEWCTIERFTIRDVASQIRDYIEMWRLMPGTKCTLITKEEVKMLKNKGSRYYVDALFSNPTPRCPNPLAVAKVHFYIHVPELMPRYYPVMVTYGFEGFKSIYYALGHRQMRSLEFQRFFIDTILHMKLSFYAELFECRFAEDHVVEEEGSEVEPPDFECEDNEEGDGDGDGPYGASSVEVELETVAEASYSENPNLIV